MGNQGGCVDNSRDTDYLPENLIHHRMNKNKMHGRRVPITSIVHGLVAWKERVISFQENGNLSIPLPRKYLARIH
jgi:hypothetical protein